MTADENICVLYWKDENKEVEAANESSFKKLVQQNPYSDTFFWMDQPQSLFHLIPSSQAHITNFTTNRYVKKCPSSRYTVPGFELTTFGTWVSSHDH